MHFWKASSPHNGAAILISGGLITTAAQVRSKKTMPRLDSVGFPAIRSTVTEISPRDPAMLLLPLNAIALVYRIDRQIRAALVTGCRQDGLAQAKSSQLGLSAKHLTVIGEGNMAPTVDLVSLASGTAVIQSVCSSTCKLVNAR